MKSTARGSTRSSSPKRRPLKPARSTCTALVLSDGSLRRQREWDLYQVSCRRLEARTQEFKTFEQEELTAHRLWIESHFAKELTELRSLQLKLMEQVELIALVEDYADRAEISQALAYVRIVEAKANDSLAELWLELETKAHSGADTSDEDNEFENVWKEFEELFSDDFADSFETSGKSDHDSFASQKSQRQGKTKGSPRKEPSLEEDSLKSLYHKLMRLLHPDTNPEQSLEQKAQFLAVQEAYLASDIERLEKLFEQITSSSEGLFKADEASISDIMGRRKQVEKRLRELTKQMSSAKLHPAWGFLLRQQNPKQLKRYSQELKAEIVDELVNARYELLETETVLRSWEKKAKRASQPKASRKKLSGRGASQDLHT